MPKLDKNTVVGAVFLVGGLYVAWQFGYKRIF